MLDHASPRHPVVVLTGASSGIGRAIALRLLRRDLHLVLVARRRTELEETVRLAGDGARERTDVVTCDLSDPVQLRALADALRERGRVDALINNAGIGSSCRFTDEGALDDIQRMLDLNVRAPIELTHLLLDELAAASGTVVNISSVAGLVGTPDSPVYSATKWALTGFSEALRAACTPRGIRVVCVQPGPVPTPGWPHERFVGTLAGRVFATDVETIATCVDRALRGRGGVAPVRPRIYATIPTLRGIAPWLLRWLLVRGAQRGMQTASTGRERGTSPP